MRPEGTGSFRGCSPNLKEMGSHQSKNQESGLVAGEMVRWLRALAAFPEALGSVSSTFTVAHHL